MALIQAHNIQIKATGVGCVVQNNPIAKMMYYVNCVNVVLSLSSIIPNISKFTNYRNYHQLTAQEIGALIKLMIALDIRQLQGKCFFYNPQLCGNKKNQFYEIGAVQNSLLLTENIAIHIQGVTMKANKIMVYNKNWVMQYYVEPLQEIGEKIKQEEQRLNRQKIQQQFRRTQVYTIPKTRRQTNSCCTLI